jgi:hypothetical protein
MSASSPDLDLTDARPAPEERLPRCCPRHPDWPTLAHHLLEEFPSIPVADVVKEVTRAKTAVRQHGLEGADGLVTGELIVRHQLMLLAGQRSDVARLDPSTHVRAGATG